MADDSPGAPGPTVDLDAEGGRLRLEAEKAKYLEAIAKARQGVVTAEAESLKSRLGTITDAPAGKTELGDDAGAFGQWRAHETIDAVAKAIADEVVQDLPQAKGGRCCDRRVLVVHDRSLIADDWTSRRVRDALHRATRRIAALRTTLEEATAAVARGVDDDTGQEQQRLFDSGTRRRGGPASAPASSDDALPVGLPGALGAAVDLIGLLRTDYAVAANTVAAGPAELVTLTAAHLAAHGCAVEADVFATLPKSPTGEALSKLLDDRDDVVTALSELERELAPVEAELATITAQLTIVEQQWAKAASDTNGASQAERLRLDADRRARRAILRQRVAAPARALITHAQRVVLDVDAVVGDLGRAPEGGEAPLVTAARRERLDVTTDGEAITHVLYVTLDNVAADTVTRRSFLGPSGVLRYLAAANASWLLLDTATGTVHAGGTKNSADVLTFSLETGKASYQDAPRLEQASTELVDKGNSFECSARVLVFVVILVLAILGVLSLLAVVNVALD